MTEMEHLVSSMGENRVCTVIQCMLTHNYIVTLTLDWIHHKFLKVISQYVKTRRSVLAS